MKYINGCGVKSNFSISILFYLFLGYPRLKTENIVIFIDSNWTKLDKISNILTVAQPNTALYVSILLYPIT